MRLVYLPIETYPERYTGQLRHWVQAAVDKRGVDFLALEGQTLSGGIETGVVLDAHGRSYYGLTQLAALVDHLKKYPMAEDDVIWIADMFTPGLEVLPYIFDQLGTPPPRIYAQCHAQSVDPHDFTFKMRHWMRHYELMLDKVLSGIFVGSTVHAQMLQAALFTAPIHVVGLPFSESEVAQYAPLVPFEERPLQVIFSSRWDNEKQPLFYLEVARWVKAQHPEVDFLVTTSAPTLRSNNPALLREAYDAAARGLIRLHTGLSKREYYQLVSRSRVQFNCALQDFVSYTLLEASTYRVTSIVPSYLSMPEAVFNNPDCMYRAWSVSDAANQVLNALEALPFADIVSRPARWHSQTLNRMLSIMENQ